MGKGNWGSLRLALAVELPSAKSDRHCDWIDRHCGQKFRDELLPARFSLGGVGAGRAVCQLDQRYDGDADSGSADFASDGGKHLPSIFPLTLRCDQNPRVEDQSPAGGAKGPRWVSIAAPTSFGKAG